MKKIAPNIFYILYLAFMYGVPLALFGGIMPYFHGELGAGLSKMGCVALFALAVIVSAKIRDRIKDGDKSLGRGVLLMLFPIAWYVIINIALREVLEFVTSLVSYWHYCFIFIVIGAVFYVLYESASEEEK